MGPFDGIGKGLCAWEVPCCVAASEFGFAKKSEKNVWSKWKRTWVILLKDEGGGVFRRKSKGDEVLVNARTL